MPQRSVASNYTFEQQRTEINSLAADFWTQKTNVDNASSTYLKHNGSNDFTGGTLNVPNAFTISPDSGNGTLTISGNLNVTGTTTTVNTTNLDVTDKNITIAKGNNADSSADGAGLTIDSATDITWNFVDAKDAWVSSIGIEADTFLKAPYGQFTAATTPTTGQGVEVNAPDANTGQVSSYDRDNSAYKDLRIKGTGIDFYAGSTNAIVGGFHNTGLVMQSGKTIELDDTIVHSGDSDTKIRFPAGDTVQFETGGSNRLSIDTNALFVQAGFPLAFLATSGGATPHIKSGGTNNQDLLFTTGAGNPNRLYITAAGKILGGNHLNDRGAVLQIESSDHAQIGIHRNTADHGAPAMNFSASRGTSAGAVDLVQDEDYLGLIRFAGADGVDLASGAQITAIVDGTAASNVMPTRLGFWTSLTNESPVERLRIQADGKVLVGDGSAITPVKHFDVRGAGNQGILIGSTDNNGAQIILDGNGGGDASGGNYGGIEVLNNGDFTIRNHDASQKIIFGVGSASGANDSVVIKSDGNVGINNDNPTVKLAVDGGTTSDLTTVQIKNDSTSAYATTDGGLNTSLSLFSDGTSDTQGVGIQFYLQKSGQTGAISEIGATRESSGNSNLVFRTRDSSTGVNERMRITSGGLVSVGGISPAFKFEVNGGADDSVCFAGRTDGGNGNNARFTLKGFADGGGANYGGGLKIQTRDSVNVFHDRLTITSGGDVKIGLDSVTTRTDSAHYGFNLTGKSGTTGAGSIFFLDSADNCDANICADNGVLMITADYSDNTAGSAIQFRVDGSAERMRLWDGGLAVGDRVGGSTVYSNQPVAFQSPRVNPDGADANVHTAQRCNLYVGSNTGWAAGDGGVIGLGGSGSGTASQERLWAYIKGSRQSVNGWEYAGYVDIGNQGWGTNNTEKRQRIWGNGQVEWYPTDNTLMGWQVGGAQRMKITHTGGGNIKIDNSNGTMTYDLGSDYRLKKDEVAITDALTTVKALKPYQFTYKSDNRLGQGFFAHEAQAVLPDVGIVSGTKDAVHTEDDKNEGYKKDDPIYQGIDYSKLVPLLTAALQEATAKIETLETKVAALESA